MTGIGYNNPVVLYFANIWRAVSSTVVGMRLTIRYFFRPKVTMEYPEVRPDIPEGHRGLHEYKEEECILCRACETACPVECLAISAIGKGKDRLITSFDIDYSKCLFCNLCCEACTSNCLYMGKEYDLASSSREKCVLHLARAKTEEEMEKHREYLAKKEAEKKAKKEPSGEQSN